MISYTVQCETPIENIEKPFVTFIYQKLPEKELNVKLHQIITWTLFSVHAHFFTCTCGLKSLCSMCVVVWMWNCFCDCTFLYTYTCRYREMFAICKRSMCSQKFFITNNTLYVAGLFSHMDFVAGMSEAERQGGLALTDCLPAPQIFGHYVINLAPRFSDLAIYPCVRLGNLQV